MKKISLILFLLACTLTAAAQDGNLIKQGDDLFAAGQYAEAKKKYEGWNFVNAESTHATRRIAECDECMKLSNVADYLYSENKLTEAREKYTEILSINPADPVAKKRIAEIDSHRPEMNGVTINGITWATRNVDSPGTFAPRPESLGMLYQWNRRKAWPATGNEVSGWDDAPAPGDRWEPANDPCPEGWRVPTTAEFERLDSVGSVWTNINGVNGRRFGSGSNTIFLPAAGYRDLNGSFNLVGSAGYYWSASPYDTSSIGAGILNFSSGHANPANGGPRAYGYTVRCVQEF